MVRGISMLDYCRSPKKIQFELSNLCNALCLGCVRTDTTNYNESKSFIKNKQIVEIDTFKKLLTSPGMSTVEILEFCGTIDEPLMHPNFFDILELSNKINPNFKIVIHTNASLRSVDDWSRLANLLKKFKSHRILFSIDGVEEQHEFYRQKTSYKKIIENVKSFISSGGFAVWQFIVFPWNQHQVEIAKQTSQDLGFQEFVSRIDRSGVSKFSIDHIHKLKLLNKKKDQNQSLDINNLIKSYKKIENYSITCRYRDEGMYFLSYDSRLWPCCFLANGFLSNNQSQRDFQTKRIYEIYGYDFNDLTIYSVDKILESDFFKKDLVSSWNNSISTNKDGKLIRCAETCNNNKLQYMPVGQYKEVVKHYE
jgi:MoaA/NifB/PqqE/SkfB family radical SAM enzyme